MHRVPDTLQAWITAMNEAAKKISIPVINKFNSPLILTTITSINIVISYNYDNTPVLNVV